MVTCRDVLNLKLDGVELIAGANGLDRMVSWTYLVQTEPYDEHMNRGNFALLVVDYERYSMNEVCGIMERLDRLGISGFAISVVDDREMISEEIKDRAEELSLPLFYVRWKGASFVDIDQSIGKLIMETRVQNKREGDFLYNLLFGYAINDKYIEKILGQFGLDFSKPYRVGIIIVDRKYGINLEQDEHTYEYYGYCLSREVSDMEGHPMFMCFLNKFVLLFEARKDKAVEHELEKVLNKIDSSENFKDKISGTCILGAPYSDPRDFGKSYQQAKSLIPKISMLPNPKKKKVLSASAMGIYKFMFNSDNKREILDYCDDRLGKIEEYDHANGTFLVDTLLAYYMNGFNSANTAKTLFIHRNSLQYRLNKIQELIGLEMDDYVRYLDIVNCILVKRMMFM